MISFKDEGNFNNIERFLKQNKKTILLNKKLINDIHGYAIQGVIALSSATPKDSGYTSLSWDYEILYLKNGIKVNWINLNVIDGIPIAILIQYGHGTRNGGYVQGRDYINPALRPIFDKIADSLWREVTQS